MTKPSSADVPLDDIMIAMDVVDTLRHDQRIALRELDDDKRHDDLIKKLHEIYKGQGIEVPDHILEEGVTALKEDRFKYVPPKGGLAVKLARLYVSRDDWGRYVVGALVGLIGFLGMWYFSYERPRQKTLETARFELAEQIPSDLKKALAQIKSVADDERDIKSAQELAKQGHRAVANRDRQAAKTARNRLLSMRDELERDFHIRIVTRRGELSGLWRIPKKNRRARNYYLIVEAVSPDGKILTRPILNEETGKRETVKIWAVRVPRDVLNKVQDDKRDDGIIQNAIVASKKTGSLKPQWRIQRSGGEITKW